MAGETKARMIAGAVRLLAQKGLQETSFQAVLEATGAPRGSIYHHFPDGKDQLVAAAVDLAGSHAASLLDSLAGLPADEVTRRFLGMWRHVLVASDFTAGCSVLAVTIATDSTDLLEHTSAVFRGWRQHLARLLADGGLSAERAARFSATLVAGSEGAVVMSRAERDLEPFELVAAQLIEQVEGLLREAA